MTPAAKAAAADVPVDARRGLAPNARVSLHSPFTSINASAKYAKLT
jgi:hypothetical protein